MTKRQIRCIKIVLLIVLFFVILLWAPQPIMQQENTKIYQVYCVGDSITYGSGVEEEERELCCYPAVLEQLLGTHYEVTNYGISGKTLLHVPEKYYRDTEYANNVLQQQPDVVIIMLGTNDSHPERWDAAAYKAEYRSFISDLQMLDSHPKIYVMAPPKAFPLEDGEIVYGINDEIIHNEIEPAVREVADETGVTMIDLYAVTEKHPEYFTDGVHPNRDGYAIVAQAVYEQMEKEE